MKALEITGLTQIFTILLRPGHRPSTPGGTVNQKVAPVSMECRAVLASLAGLAISIYLTVVHYSTVPLACPASAVVNCEQVLSSRYAVIGDTGLPTSAAGIVWFAVSVALARRMSASILATDCPPSEGSRLVSTSRSKRPIEVNSARLSGPPRPSPKVAAFKSNKPC